MSGLRRPMRPVLALVPGLVVPCLVVACGRDAGPAPPAAAAPPSSVASPPVPAAPPSTAGARIAVHALPGWSSPPETLLTHPSPIWDLRQTRTHVGWAEPQEPQSGRFKASALAVAKASPARVEVLAGVAVDTKYVRLTTLTSSASSFFLVVPGPGEAVAAAAIVIDAAKRVRTQSLPPNVSVFDSAPLAAAFDDTLVVASDVVNGSSTLHVLAPGAPPRTLRVDGDMTAIAAHDRDVVVVRGANAGASAARLDTATMQLAPATQRPKLIEAIAVHGGATVWSELEQEGFRINSVFATDAKGVTKAIGKTEMPHHLQVAGDRACWTTFEPAGGPSAYDARQNPVGAVDTFVVCASLSTGALERAVGPLPQQALGFVVDERHVYWAEVAGPTTILKRRAVP